MFSPSSSPTEGFIHTGTLDREWEVAKRSSGGGFDIPGVSSSPKVTIYEGYNNLEFSKDLPPPIALGIEAIRDQIRGQYVMINEMKDTMVDIKVQLALLKELYEMTRKEMTDEMWKKITPAILDIDKRCTDMASNLIGMRTEMNNIMGSQISISKKLDHLDAK
jgi:hypothetical protein